MNLLAMTTRLRRMVGSPDEVDAPNADLVEFLNEAYRDIAASYRFHSIRKLCQFSTIIGTARYGLPAGCEAVLRVRDDTNGCKITKAGDRRAATIEASTSAITGKPLYYVRQRDWLLLDPVPDGVYVMEVFYKAGIVSMVADQDVPVLPDAWHTGIVRLARHKFYDDRGNLPKATYTLAAYNSWLSTKTVEVDEEAVDIDSGVELPTLSGDFHARRLDFNHSE